MAAQAKKTNWFAIWVSIGTTVALALVVTLVFWLNNMATDVGQAPEGANVDVETGAILVGSGDKRLDTYLDFMCPGCGSFEAAYGETIEGLVDEGTITLGIHPISILDRLSAGTDYSTRAANAMYCVAESDEDATLPFLQSMFANQPEEGSVGLSDEQILTIAEGVGVTDVASCMEERTYGDFVAGMTKRTPLQPGQPRITTPTIA
ncbi:MAG: DsbA family protein, partial [Actinomycetales bacterium]